MKGRKSWWEKDRCCRGGEAKGTLGQVLGTRTARTPIDKAGLHKICDAMRREAQKGRSRARGDEENETSVGCDAEERMEIRRWRGESVWCVVCGQDERQDSGKIRFEALGVAPTLQDRQQRPPAPHQQPKRNAEVPRSEGCWLGGPSVQRMWPKVDCWGHLMQAVYGVQPQHPEDYSTSPALTGILQVLAFDKMSKIQSHRSRSTRLAALSHLPPFRKDSLPLSRWNPPNSPREV